MIAWPLVWDLVKSYWKPMLFGLAVIGVYLWHWHEVNKAWHDGREALKIEQAEEARRKGADAQAADDAARKCAADPACRLRDDKYLRP